MNCVLYQLKCLFGPYGCSCLCISPVRQSATTRVMYSLMLIIVSIICAFIHERKSIEFTIQKFSPFVNKTCIYLQANSSCVRLLGFKAIYRIAYSFSAFHLLMMVFCIQISSSDQWRAKIHNGFWFFKFLLIMIFWTVLFLFPIVENYVTIVTIVGIVAALAFIIIQDVSLIDCAYEFNGYLREKGSKNCCYAKFLYLAAIFLYLLTVGGYGLLYYNFALPRKCTKNRIIIIINASATAILVIFSFIVGKHNQNKLYIPAAVTSLFVFFLTWTAIKSAPYEMVAINYKPINSYEARFLIPYNNKSQIFKCEVDFKFHDTSFGQDLDNYLGILVMLGTAVYCTIKSTVNYKRYGIKPTKSKNFSTSQMQFITNDIELQEIKDKSTKRISGSHLMSAHGDEFKLLHKSNSMPAVNFISSKKSVDGAKKKVSIKKSSKQKTKLIKKNSYRANTMSDIEEGKPSNENLDLLRNCPIDSYLIHDEHFGVIYSYSWLHFIFSLAYLFVMVQLTNWYSPQTSHIKNFAKSWPSLWMKITTSWIALALFGWTLLCPAFCIGRRLYEHPFDSMKRYRKQAKQSKPIES